MPLVFGQPVWNPELSNLARNSGKVFMKYFSPYNATLFLDTDTGQPIRASPLHQAKSVTVHIPDMLALVYGAAQTSNGTLFYGLSVQPTKQGFFCKYDHPVPKGLLHGCPGHDC